MNRAVSLVTRAPRIAARAALVWLMMGRQRQSFVGARWIAHVVRWCPPRYRAALALRVLALSPHYFIRRFSPQAAAAEPAALLATELRRNQETRKRLFERVIRPLVPAGSRVLDYGCGAGFLAAAAGDELHVYAVDIAAGVLACAEVLNAHPNVRYLRADDRGLRAIPDGGVDAAWLIAVTQHLTLGELDRVVGRCAAKVREDGRLLMHAALGRENWLSEEDWRSDQTRMGRLAFEYSLNCFRRDAGHFVRALEDHGFIVEEVIPIRSLCGDEPFDDICHDHLIVARRTARG